MKILLTGRGQQLLKLLGEKHGFFTVQIKTGSCNIQIKKKILVVSKTHNYGTRIV